MLIKMEQGNEQCRHQELILDVNADGAEFCTAPGFFQLLAVGTYQLDEATRERHGRLHVYSLATTSSSSSSASTIPSLELAATLDLPGIFDLQWSQLPSIHDMPCIGLALADGSIQLLGVAAMPAAAEAASEADGDAADSRVASETVKSAGSIQLHHLSSCQAVPEGMALYLDWNTQQQQQQQAAPLAAVSSSSGAVSVLQASVSAWLLRSPTKTCAGPAE